MKRTFCYLLLSLNILIFNSCDFNIEKFDRKVWITADGLHQEHRKNMVNDLMKHHLKTGMSYNEIIDLLGLPDKSIISQENVISYEVYEDFGWDIDPISYTCLNIKLERDSTLADFKLKEIKVK